MYSYKMQPLVNMDDLSTVLKCQGLIIVVCLVVVNYWYFFAAFHCLNDRCWYVLRKAELGKTVDCHKVIF